MSTTKKPQHGCENLSNKATYLLVMWMTEAFVKFLLQTLKDTHNVTSSQVLADGPTHSNLQDGRKINPFGQAHVLASLLAQPEKDLPKPTNATSGPCSSILSASAALSLSLGSRLQTQLGTDGSMEYQQTWRVKTTPAGRQYWAHIPSKRRTKDKDCIGWPTPDTCAGGTGPSQADRHTMRLQDAVQTMGWTTPNARDHKDAACPEALMRAMDSEKGSANLPRQVAMISGWCSPTVTDAARGVMPPRPQYTGIPLTQQVSGLTVERLSVVTETDGAFHLNPHFPRWLMGFPPEWCDCAVTAMQSFPKSRRSSSKPQAINLSEGWS